ncbi:unnamed protein product (macronuclear) [Paramecium tetraurelia]|uniref:Protein kinase domain-containing protein n=1 Tax=Paramecium tetraurelia TaxID=5888 RepID=A0D6Z6_PARTE|nr:uncharacterized protein GSPATT00001854001 [Paramecium tetraurelia]CAK78813.1 unnamed protein product [Paramecium tetraurelia]|eukprot:XP_001446210.1 hypothetical protein (macronuclear) [Paramecium tetraurelia strain d4-2]
MIQSLGMQTKFHKQMEKMKGFLVSAHNISPINDDEPIRKTQTPLIGQQVQSISFSDDEMDVEDFKQIGVKSTNFDDEFTLGKKLGEGTNGVVRICWKKDNPQQQFAVKIIQTPDEEQLDIVRQAFVNSTIIKSPYIAKCYKLYIDINVIYMLMEYVPFPNLQTILQQRTQLKEQEVQRIACSLLKSARCLHSCGICHRDIKPDNVLVNPNDYTVKLIDFGVSRRFVTFNNSTFRYMRNQMLTVTGNLHYRAPEIMGSHIYGYNQQVDIWAIGVIMYQSLTSVLPFTSDNTADIVALLSNRYSISFQKPQFLSLSSSCRDLIKRLMMWNPLKRLTASEALKHIWIPNMQTPQKPLCKKIKIVIFLINLQLIVQPFQILSYKILLSKDITKSQKSLGFSIKIKREKEIQDFKAKLKQFKLETSTKIYKRNNSNQNNAIQLVGALVDDKMNNSIKLDDEDDIFGIKVCGSHHSLTQIDEPIQNEQQAQHNKLDPQLLEKLLEFNL